MAFHTANFFIFFLALLIPYLLFKRARIWLLAAANVLFYAAAGIGPLILFFAVTTITYIVIQCMRHERLKWAFWIGIAVNAGNLLFFKYTIFILDTIQLLSGWEWLHRDSLEASIVLPIGISFYTFQFISYLIDVRRGVIEPASSFVRFWVYIALFPPLIAGPIMRGNELMPQLDEIKRKTVRWQEIKYGMMLVLWGLVKKIIFADRLAEAVDPLFAQGMEMSGTDAWIAAFLFGFQIYFDFSAYSDMALGLGHMLGLRLVLNFNSPYISTNPSEFWTRWHISLSRWIRDYIYISLGGNRRRPIRVHFNLMAAMLISGLWHGAMWTFVFWGALHGMLSIVYKWTLHLNRINWIQRVREHVLYRVLAVFVFFHIISWTWVFFRAESLSQAVYMTKQMFAAADWSTLYARPEMLWVVLLFLLHLLEHGVRNYASTASKLWHWVPFPLRSAFYFMIVMTIFYFLKGETNAFIYFQF